MNPTDKMESAPSHPLLRREKVVLSVTSGMGVTPDVVSSYGMGVEIQDFAGLSGMRGGKEANLAYWREFLDGWDKPRTFHAPFIGLHLGSDKLKEREYADRRIAASLEVAGSLGVDLVVMHSGWAPPSWRKYGNWDDLDHIKSHIEKMVDVAYGLGLTIAVENVYEPVPGILTDMVEGINRPNVCLCLDTGHANVKSEVPIEEWVASFGSFLGYIHLHDNLGKKDDHFAVGMGSINFEPFFDALKEMRYADRICIESWPSRWEQSIAALVKAGIIPHM